MDYGQKITIYLADLEAVSKVMCALMDRIIFGQEFSFHLILDPSPQGEGLCAKHLYEQYSSLNDWNPLLLKGEGQGMRC